MSIGNALAGRWCPGGGWCPSEPLWKMFGNDLTHVTSLDASAAIFLVLVSAAPAGAHQGFGVAKYQD